MLLQQGKDVAFVIRKGALSCPEKPDYRNTYTLTREEAIRKMRAALCELVIDGIPTNISEQLGIIGDERFVSGRYDLTFMGNR